MKTTKLVSQSEQNLLNCLEEKDELIKEISRSLNSIGTDDIIQRLNDVAHNEKHELKQAIRELTPSDTDWHVDKIFAIMDAITFLHTTKCRVDEYNTLQECFALSND